MFRVHHYHHYSGLESLLNSIVGLSHKVDHLSRQMETLMALSDDLKAALTDLTTEVTRIAGEIDQLLAVIATPGIPAADAQAAIDQARSLVAALRAASDKSDAAVPTA